MSALATLLLKRGAQLSGSDMRASLDLARLAERGARVTTNQRAEAIPDEIDLVVASAAIPATHPELRAARRRGLRVMKYAELLGELMSRYDGVAISGTHGKSTTTAWLAFTMKRAGLDPSFVVGATVPQLGGGSGVGDGPHFVAEACEFDRSFLNLRPRRTAILNIEEDHLDCYEDLDAIRDAFAEFAGRNPAGGLVVLNGEDPCCRAVSNGLAANVQTFGTRKSANWRATDIAAEQGLCSFDVLHDGAALGRASLGIPGRHNVDNALAVIALASDCGVSWPLIRAALREFRGADRRLQQRGQAGDIRILDDYAHHPTEIRATLRAARERYSPRRLWCVFQPHQHSRTRFLLADFAVSLDDADEVLVPDIYFVRDSERDRESVSAADLVTRIRQRGGAASYVARFEEIGARLAREARPGDLVLTMGAGDIWKVADDLLSRLGGNLPA